MPGRLVILSGPSGVGKDTLIARWAERNPLVQRVVAYTTRAPRAGEVNGVDYNFVSFQDFKRMESQGAFLESKEVHGNWYATPLKDLDGLLNAGKIAILKIDVQGGEQVMKQWPQTLTVFLLPPNLDELETRIRSRALDSDADIEKRLQNAIREMEMKHLYNHIVTNADVEKAVDDLEKLVS